MGSDGFRNTPEEAAGLNKSAFREWGKNATRRELHDCRSHLSPNSSLWPIVTALLDQKTQRIQIVTVWIAGLTLVVAIATLLVASWDRILGGPLKDTAGGSRQTLIVDPAPNGQSVPEEQAAESSAAQEPAPVDRLVEDSEDPS